MNEFLKTRYSEEDEPYIKMIYDIAHKYAENARCSFEDYVNVGLMGLHKARETFNKDNEEGAKFQTHAYNVIYRDIMKEWQNSVNELSCSPYHVKNTDGARDEVAFQNATKISMYQKDKDGNEVINEGFGPSGITTTNKIAKAVPSGLPSPEQYAEHVELVEKVNAILDSLDSDDKEIIISHDFQGETFQHIADKKGVTWRKVYYRHGILKEDLKDKFTEAGLDIYA